MRAAPPWDVGLLLGADSPCTDVLLRVCTPRVYPGIDWPGFVSSQSLENLVLFLSLPSWSPGGWPAVSISLLPITQARSWRSRLPPTPARHHHLCIRLPPGSVHGKTQPLAAPRPTALSLVPGQRSPTPQNLPANSDQPLPRFCSFRKIF